VLFEIENPHYLISRQWHHKRVISIQSQAVAWQGPENAIKMLISPSILKIFYAIKKQNAQETGLYIVASKGQEEDFNKDQIFFY
jgi:hypothetical protein